MKKYIFGRNWQTTLGGVFTAIGSVPAAISYLNLATIPQWLKVFGLSCSFISFIYMSVMAKSKNVTGTGDTAQTNKEIKNSL